MSVERSPHIALETREGSGLLLPVAYLASFDHLVIWGDRPGYSQTYCEEYRP